MEALDLLHVLENTFDQNVFPLTPTLTLTLTVTLILEQNNVFGLMIEMTSFFEQMYRYQWLLSFN